MESAPGKKLTIFLSEDNVYKHRPLYEAVLNELSKAGIRQVAATRGIAGYGRDTVIHTSNIEVLSTNLPVVVEAVDVEAKIGVVLSAICEIADEALIEVMPTQLIEARGTISDEEGGTA